MPGKWAALVVMATIGALSVITLPVAPMTQPAQAFQTPELPSDLAKLESLGATIDWEVHGVIRTISPDPILSLDRILVGAGNRFDVETASPALLYVEHGPVAIGSDIGGMAPYESGQALARSSVRQLVVENPTGGCISLLRLIIAYPQGTLRGAAVAGPVMPNCETEVEHLWGTPMGGIGMEGMPGPNGLAYLARVRWPPGQGAGGELTLDGPMGVLVESGALRATPGSAIEEERIQDDAVLLKMNTRWELANAGPEPVNALVVGVVPADPSGQTWWSMPALPLITDYLPDSLPVDYAACFQAPDAQVLSFDDLIGRFANPEEVASLLDAWGWQTSAYRAFTCDAPAAGEAGLIDMSVHRFADDASAQHALRYFVEDRAAALNLVPSPAPVMGDLALALEGPTASGGDYTLYVSSGPMLVRVTGVAPSGTPTTNVLSVTQEILKTVAPLESS